MPVVGSRQVQVSKHQREEAERKRCESHNPSGARPALVPLFLLSQAACRSQHPSGQKTPFQVPGYLNNGVNQGDFNSNPIATRPIYTSSLGVVSLHTFKSLLVRLGSSAFIRGEHRHATDKAIVTAER